MGAYHNYGLLQRVLSGLSKVRATTWLILGGVALALFGLMVWAGIALLSWLWAQAPQVAGAGQQLADEAMTRVEEVAPRLKNEAEKWLPGGGDALPVAGTGQQLADEAMTRVEEVVPGLKEGVEKWLPGRGDALPEKDVSGSDPGPADRFPGLVRSHFSRDETKIEATYVGRADFDAVLTHYVQSFAAEGFTQEVLAAAAEEERHQFVGASGRFEVRIGRRPSGVVEVDVRHILQ